MGFFSATALTCAVVFVSAFVLPYLTPKDPRPDHPGAVGMKGIEWFIVGLAALLGGLFSIMMAAILHYRDGTSVWVSWPITVIEFGLLAFAYHRYVSGIRRVIAEGPPDP